MDSQLKKGLMDACVLSTLTGGEAYGYKLAQDISKVMAMSESTLYPILRRMEQQGYLVTRNSEHNGRLRKYYSMTQAGVHRLTEFKAEWTEVKRLVDYIIKEGVGS